MVKVDISNLMQERVLHVPFFPYNNVKHIARCYYCIHGIKVILYINLILHTSIFVILGNPALFIY